MLELTGAEDGSPFVEDLPEGAPDLDGIVITVGFALVRADRPDRSAGRLWLQAALDRTLRFYGDAYADAHALMTRDLVAF